MIFIGFSLFSEATPLVFHWFFFVFLGPPPWFSQPSLGLCLDLGWVGAQPPLGFSLVFLVSFLRVASERET